MVTKYKTETVFFDQNGNIKSGSLWTAQSISY
jgi:hypothetical protein